MKKKNIIIITIVAVVLIGALIAGIFIFNNGNKPVTETPNPSVDVSVESTTDSSSWANAVWLNVYDKTHVKNIEIATTKPESSLTSWKYGDTTISDNSGNITIYNPKKIAVSSAENMFAGFTNLESITGLNNFDFSACKNFSGMFEGCSNLKNIDLSRNDLSQAVNTSNMFKDCLLIQDFKTDSQNFNALSTADSMFEGCMGLRTITMPATPNLKSAEKMFAKVGGGEMQTVQILGALSFENVENLNYTFSEATLADYTFIEKMNPKNVTTAIGTFNTCNVEKLDLSSWDVSKLTRADYFIKNCMWLSSLNLDGWNCAELTSCEGMFDSNTGMEQLTLNWTNANKVKNINSMFSECSSLESLDITFFNGLAFETANRAFYCLDNVTTIKCSGITADSSTEMFLYSDKLVGAIAYDETKLTVEYANTNGYFTN